MTSGIRLSTTIFTLLLLIGFCASSLDAQNSSGFIFFSGSVASVSSLDEGRRVQLAVNVLGASMSVLVDENTTFTGSLGGRASVSTLTPNLFVEVEGWMASDGVVRASNVQTKVQSGAIRMYGRIENILPASGATALIIDGVEMRVDSTTNVVVNRGGIGAAGPVTDLKIGDFADVTASYVDDTGVGQTTAGLFHASSVVVQRSFRIQGPIRSRTPVEGTPTIITVQGIVVTVTPDTTIVGNGLNERNEAFLAPKSGAGPVVNPIEDDAGNPCTNPPFNCPDKPPSDPSLAGELRIGAFVRVEGMLENTGFSTRYTARAIQVEKPEQIRFHAIVEGRTATLLSLRINETVRTQVILDAATRIDGQIETGRLVEISARFNPDLSLAARRIRVLP